MSHQLDERDALRAEIEYWLKRWRLGQKAWSAAHHGSLFGATIISVAIAFIVQLDAPLLCAWSNETLSTVLAFCAAVLSALAAAGGFERKWRANRLSRGRLDELRIDFLDVNADLPGARDRLKRIIRMHDQEVLGGMLRADPAGKGASRADVNMGKLG